MVPGVKASPVIASVIRKITQGSLEYAGGRLETARSTAPPSLTSFTASVGFIDELDKWTPQPDSDRPMTSVENRGAGFAEMFRLIAASTPHGKAGSWIFQDYKECSQCQFEVPCYYRRCREMQLLTEDTVEAGELHCRECGRAWSDKQRWEMICDPRADWATRNLDFDPAFRSYQVNSFYAPAPLSYTLKRAPGDPRAFSSQVMGWPYDDEVAAPPEPDELERLFTDIEVEDLDALFLAVDVQQNRLEYMLSLIHI